jgi:hypothetical protein
MRSVSMIQRRMAAEPHHLVPELLGMTGTPPMPTPPAAMGLLYALDAIRHRQCLAVALTRLPRQDSGLHDAVRAAYLDRVAGDELAEPDAHAVETARAELGQIRLRRGWPRYRRRP